MANKLIVLLADKAGNRILGNSCIVSVNLTVCDSRVPPETIETMNIVNILPSSIIINIDRKYTSTAQPTGLHKTLFYVSATLHGAITGFPVYVNGPRRLHWKKNGMITEPKRVS
jgi:hypothetical protein